MQPWPLHPVHRGAAEWKRDQRRQRRPTGEMTSCAEAHDGRKAKPKKKTSSAATNDSFHYGWIYLSYY